MTKKRQRWREGDVVSIDLGAGLMGFGRVLKKPLLAFYGLRSPEPVPAEEVVRGPVLFKVYVLTDAITGGGWPVIGSVPLAPDLRELPRFFKTDPISGELSLYFDDGSERPAKSEEIEGLECAAVWEPAHVVERLNDHFAGRPNTWVESMKPR